MRNQLNNSINNNFSRIAIIMQVRNWQHNKKIRLSHGGCSCQFSGRRYRLMPSSLSMLLWCCGISCSKLNFGRARSWQLQVWLQLASAALIENRTKWKMDFQAGRYSGRLSVKGTAAQLSLVQYSSVN